MSSANDVLMANLLEGIGENNPKMKMLAQLMQQQNQQSSQAVPAENKIKERCKKLLLVNKKLQNKLMEMKEQQAELLSYLQFFIEQNANLASATGACECWGEDHQCERCHGQGKPGYFPVDEPAFSHYLQPAVQQREMRIKADQM